MLTTLFMCLLLAAASQALNCSVDDPCSGRQVVLGDGSCYTLPSPCNDGFSCTTDSCDARSGICSHVTTGTSCAKCKVQCVTDCNGKACGEDGCGGFCGVCKAGLGCSGGVCTAAGAAGSCSLPISLDPETITGTGSQTVEGDTNAEEAVHVLTPQCNWKSASPELYYRFIIPTGKTIGYEIRVSGYDTVLQLMKGNCNDTDLAVACNDDATPPGDYGSAIYGKLTAGTYYIMVDGYDSTAKGAFTMSIRFIENCQPLCDGAFCGPDGCGFQCGSCESYQFCNTAARCINNTCQKKCGTTYNRSCGEDGCGGSCGSCSTGYSCYGASITPDEGATEIPGSVCTIDPSCDYMNPTCTPACGANSYCTSRCRCAPKTEKFPDFVVVAADLVGDTWLQRVNFPSTSCTLIEGCIGAAGERNLLRFTASSANQGQVDFSPPPPKSAPEQFVWGTCHQHYHYRAFMLYQLLTTTRQQVGSKASKAAFCMEDSRREIDGPAIACDKAYDCGYQGIQAGWADSYGWSLDCSWIDVTDVAAGEYVLRVQVNPEHRIEEQTYANNDACVKLQIPGASGFGDVATRLTGILQVDCALYTPQSSGTVARIALAILLSVIGAALF